MKYSVGSIVAGMFIIIYTGCSGPDKKCDESNNMRSYLIRKATEITENSLSGINSLNDWQKIRDKRSHEFSEMTLLICQADRDGLNKIESVRELYKRVGAVYKLYNATGNIGLVETPGGHSYHRISREAIFSFFMKHLMNKDVSPSEAGDIDESEQNQLSEEELKVYHI